MGEDIISASTPQMNWIRCMVNMHPPIVILKSLARPMGKNGLGYLKILYVPSQARYDPAINDSQSIVALARGVPNIAHVVMNVIAIGKASVGNRSNFFIKKRLS